MIERPTQGRFPQALVRYPIEAQFSDVTDVTIEDGERIGMLIVGNIAYDRSAGLLRVEAAIPGRLLIQTVTAHAEVRVEDHRSEMRRWGRWRSHYRTRTRFVPIGRDPAGRTTRLTWTGAATMPLGDDSVTRSQSGRVIDESIDGIDAYPAGPNFTYDGAGRLITAKSSGHTLAYGFAPRMRKCDGRWTKHQSHQRHRQRTTNTYCYDGADRLTSTSDAAVGSPVYDSHGNTTTLGNQTMAYAGADRHRSITVAGLSVTYVRDATDRIISRTEATTTVNYGFSGPGDSSGFILDNVPTKAVVERTMGLVGGAMVTKRTTGAVWSYPNIHGDVMATANAAGIKQGATLTYYPFGQASAPVDNRRETSTTAGWAVALGLASTLFMAAAMAMIHVI